MFAALALLIAALPALAQPSRPPSGKLIHLRIRGDLDCAKLARDVATELARVRSEEPSFILVELDGDRWRADVVWMIAQEIRATGVPAAAFLNDPRGKRAGTGQFILGLLVSTPRPTPGSEGERMTPRLFIAPKTIIGLDPGEDLRDAAPEETDWESVDREMHGAAWLALASLGVDTELAAACLAPTDSVWAVADDATGRRRLTIKRPQTEAGAVQIVERTAAIPSPRVSIDAQLAAELGVVRSARNVGDVLTACGVQPRGRVTIEVASGMDQARRDVCRLVSAVEAAVRQAEQTLNDIPRSYRGDYEQKKARAGREAAAVLKDAASALTKAESIIADYPEILRTNPPTRTPVGQDQRTFRDEWRRLFQSLRNEITRLAARADEYAER